MSKVIKVLMIIFMVLMILQNAIYAGDVKIDTSGVTIGGTNAISSSKKATENFLGTVQVVGSILSVAALIILGIRYMASSLEDKAEMKGVFIYYVIGAILVFATTNVLSIVYNIMINLEA